MGLTNFVLSLTFRAALGIIVLPRLFHFAHRRATWRDPDFKRKKRALLERGSIEERRPSVSCEFLSTECGDCREKRDPMRKSPVRIVGVVGSVTQRTKGKTKKISAVLETRHSKLLLSAWQTKRRSSGPFTVFENHHKMKHQKRFE